MDCIFCKILNEELPAKKIYEDDLIIVIMDAFPNVDGHVLLIPKIHYEDILSVPVDLISHLHKIAAMLIPKLTKAMGVESLSQVVNYGKAQVVKHYHMHLLPNYGFSKAEGEIDVNYIKILEELKK